jgi:hypothetical protein
MPGCGVALNMLRARRRALINGAAGMGLGRCSLTTASPPNTPTQRRSMTRRLSIDGCSTTESAPSTSHSPVIPAAADWRSPPSCEHESGAYPCRPRRCHSRREWIWRPPGSHTSPTGTATRSSPATSYASWRASSWGRAATPAIRWQTPVRRPVWPGTIYIQAAGDEVLLDDARRGSPSPPSRVPAGCLTSTSPASKTPT